MSESDLLHQEVTDSAVSPRWHGSMQQKVGGFQSTPTHTREHPFHVRASVRAEKVSVPDRPLVLRSLVSGKSAFILRTVCRGVHPGVQQWCSACGSLHTSGSQMILHRSHMSDSLYIRYWQYDSQQQPNYSYEVATVYFYYWGSQHEEG